MSTAGTAPRLLAVHAHPDDETLSTGALLATWASSGNPVTVVTCTRGERGEVIGDALAPLAGDGPALAAHRERELAGALAAHGVTEHVWLDALQVAPTEGHVAVGAGRYEDSGMVWLAPGRAGAAPESGHAAFARVDVDVAALGLARLLREQRPAVVVTYEPGGGYGHPDHVQAHRVATRAVRLAADPSAPLTAAPHAVPVLLWAAVDAAEHERAGGELAAAGPAPAGLRLPGPDRVPPSAAVPADQVAMRVDVRQVLDRVVGALRAHATQVQGVRTWPEADATAALGCLALSDGVLQPLVRHEVYRLAAGRPESVPWPDGVAWATGGAPSAAGTGPGRDSLTPVSANASTTTAARVWQLLGSLLLGVVVAVVGTGVHRANPPWGLVLAYLTVASAAVLARAWGRAVAMAAYGAGLVALLFAMAFWRPGGDVLVTDESIGWAWIAAPVLVLVVALLPARLFSDRPLVRRREPGQPS